MAAKSFSSAPGTVRITGGAIKGRKLAVPAGSGVRPTTDRARETLFNVLVNRFRKPGGESVLAGAQVLDAFAGTGAMGLEAWSRGAAFVAFVETQSAHFATLTENLRAAKLPAQAGTALRTHQELGGLEGLGVLERGRCSIDLIIADPPYEHGHALVTTLLARQSALWHAATLLVWEHPRSAGADAGFAGWDAVHQTLSGKTAFSFFTPSQTEGT